jgi:hypothetical protein
VQSVTLSMKSRKHEQYCNNPAALKTLDTGQLQELWTAIFKGQRRPQSTDLIMYKIAYFLQAQARGGLSVKAQNHLNRLIDGPVSQPINKYSFENDQQLVREWNGKKYNVAILDKDKFQYDCRIYKTLTAVAKEITGAHWSGPLFFGLRKQANGQRE